MFIQMQAVQEICGQPDRVLLEGNVLSPDMPGEEWNGKVQCVYADPPFMSEKNYPRTRPLGAAAWRKGTGSLKLPGFSDRFRRQEDYIVFLRAIIEKAHRLLSPTGVFYLHLDWRGSAAARLLCDEIFGQKLFLNEIIWSYETGGRSKKTFSRKHDTILMYARSGKYHFDISRLPLPRSVNRTNHMRRSVDADGRVFRTITSGGRTYKYYDDAPVYPGDVWNDISHLQQLDPERTGYPTQKPLRLLERLLLPVTKPGDLVADLCCGSGTTAAAAAALNCRFVGTDISPAALSVTAGRLQTDYNLRSSWSKVPASLSGSFDPVNRVLTLTGFTGADYPAAESEPLRYLEQIRVGHTDNEERFIADGGSFCRSRTNSALPVWYTVPESCGDDFCVSVTAADGRRYLYRWTNEE